MMIHNFVYNYSVMISDMGSGPGIRDIRTSQEPLNYRDNLRAEVSAALANRSRRKRPLLNYSEIPPHSHWMVITIFKSKQRQNRK